MAGIVLDEIDIVETAVGDGLDVANTVINISNDVTSTSGLFTGIANNIVNVVETGMQALQAAFTAFKWYFLFVFFSYTVAVLIEGANSWAQGFSNHIKCGATMLSSGVENFAYILGVLSECSWDKFVNFFNGNCTRYYIVNLVVGLLYGVFVELPILLIDVIFGLNLQPIVDFVYDVFLVPLDELFFAISGFHILRWSNDVINRCFRCKGTYHFGNGRKVTLYKTYNDWAQLYLCSTEQIIEGIIKIFTTIIPSNKWWSWANKRNLPGWDDNPGFYY